MGRNLSETISNSDLCFSQIFWSFWPRPFQNPAYATVPRYIVTLVLSFWFLRIMLGPEVRPWAKLFLALKLNLLWQNLKRTIEYLFVLFLINYPWSYFILISYICLKNNFLFSKMLLLIVKKLLPLVIFESKDINQMFQHHVTLSQRGS